MQAEVSSDPRSGFHNRAAAIGHAALIHSKKYSKSLSSLMTSARTYAAEYYRRHSQMIGRQSKQNGKKTRDRNRDWIAKYLLTHPCVDCGEADPIVLEFDHKDRTAKVFAVGRSRSMKLQKLIDEVAKCDVRCSNCHRRKTFRDRDFSTSLANAKADRDWLFVASKRNQRLINADTRKSGS